MIACVVVPRAHVTHPGHDLLSVLGWGLGCVCLIQSHPHGSPTPSSDLFRFYDGYDYNIFVHEERIRRQHGAVETDGSDVEEEEVVEEDMTWF